MTQKRMQASAAVAILMVFACAGVWAAAQQEQKSNTPHESKDKSSAHVLEKNRLAAIGVTSKGATAFILDEESQTRPIRVMQRTPFDKFAIWDKNDGSGEVILQGNVLRIESSRLFFETDKKIYAIEVGQNVRAALERPVLDIPNDKLPVPPDGKLLLQATDISWNMVWELVTGFTGRAIFALDSPPLDRNSMRLQVGEKASKSFTVDDLEQAYRDNLEKLGYKFMRWDKAYVVVHKNRYRPEFEKGILLRHNQEGLYFQAGKQAYSVRDAVIAPLAAVEVESLGLKLAPTP